MERLWGVGKVTSAKLRENGITTVGQIARLSESVLVSMLGPGSGHHLHALAHNRDPRRVRVGHRRGSIGSQRALGRRRRSTEELDAILVGLVDRVTRRMRAAGRSGRTVVLRMRFDDYSRATRSTLLFATDQTGAILAALRSLLAAADPLIRSKGLTLLGIAVSNLDNHGAVQLELPFERHTGPELDTALDGVRDRFGKAAVTRAVLLGRDQGLTVPMLPD